MANKKRFGIMAKALLVALLLVIAYSGYRIWGILEIYYQEYQLREEIQSYRPDEADAQAKSVVQVNQAIINLKQQINPEIVGWLRIPDTNIDYPVVLAKDNDYYLRRDIKGEYAYAGSIFMDYRGDQELSNFNTIIYGHNMNNGSMFGNLNKFSDPQFFEEHEYGLLFLENATYRINFFAYLVVEPNNNTIYAIQNSNPADYLNYLEKTARRYRDLGLSNYRQFRIITLSTCSYEFNDARMTLLGVLEETEETLEETEETIEEEAETFTELSRED